MGRNDRGAGALAPDKTPNPPGPASLSRLAAPAPRSLPRTTYTALALRPSPGGFELVRIEMHDEQAVSVEPMRQAEPQRAVAFAYLEQAVQDLYLVGQREG